MDGLTWNNPANTIGNVVRLRAETHPDSPAFISEDKTPLTYQALAQIIDQMRESLNEAGFGLGDRLAVVLPGGPAMATTLLGVMHAATAVPLKIENSASDLQTQLQDRYVTGVIVQADIDTPARAVAATLGLPVLEVVPLEGNVTGQVRLLPVVGKDSCRCGPAGPDDVAYVMSTAGTTSRGKLVAMRHRQHFARAKTQARIYGLGQNDRSVCFQAFHTMGALTNMACTLYAGASIIMMAKFTVDDFYRVLDALQPTWFAGSFTFQQHIYAEAGARAETIGRSSLRFIRAMSGALDREIGAGLEKTFNIPLVESYGSTEAGRITANPLPPGLRKPDTVGLVVGDEAYVGDENGNRLATGEKGEIFVRGDQVFDGYEDDPAANQAAFLNGWFRTGDEGFFDEDGYLTLTGRIKEMINRGGEKVSPQEVDKALEAHPDIVEAAAFGLPHPTLGEIVVAAIVPVSGRNPTKQVLTRFLSDHLSGFKIPRGIFVVDQIPRGPTGKILRSKLTSLFGANPRKP